MNNQLNQRFTNHRFHYKSSRKAISKRTAYIILGVIVLFGLILRVYALGSSPMWVDEMISSLAAKNILEKGVPVFDSGTLYDRAYFFHYLTALTIAIFGGDFGARFVSVIFGLATVVLVFFIGSEFSWKNEFGGKEKNYAAGLVAALFTAVMFIEVVYSRQARFYHMFQFLFFLTLLFLYKARENKKYAWFATGAFVLLVDTQIAGFVLMPFLLYVFIFERKDWKLLIIPAIVGVYCLQSFFWVASTTGTQLVSYYAEDYSSSVFFYLRAFAMIALIGVIPASRWNRRLSYLLIVPSTLLLLGIVFMQLYGLRYVYFVFLLAPIFTGVLFSYVFRETRILFILVVLVALIYPSNLFFEYSRMTMIKPESIVYASSGEPIIEYNLLSEATKKEIKSSTIVTLFTPGVEWYFKKPNYFIPFSLTGMSDGYVWYDQRDVYTNALVFKNQTNDFVLIQDLFGYSKLSDKARLELNSLTSGCEMIESKTTVVVYRCGL